MFRFFDFLLYMYLTLAVLACHVLVQTVKGKYMIKRKPKNQNMTGQNS
jgi:hypothetical protein